MANRRIIEIFQETEYSNNFSESSAVLVVKHLQDYLIKPLIEPVDHFQLLKHLHPFRCSKNTIIFREGEPIDRFYFMLRGEVEFFKKRIHVDECISLECMENAILGEFFYNCHHTRAHTAVAYSDADTEIVHGFYIEKSIFAGICQQHIREYFQMVKFLESFYTQENIDQEWLRFLRSNQFYQNVFYRKCYFGQNIIIQDAIAIIVEGECLMANQNNKHQKEKTNRIVLLKKDCLFIEKFTKSAAIYQYKAATEYTLLLCIPTVLLEHFPLEFLNKLRFLNNCHQQLLKVQNQKQVFAHSPSNNQPGLSTLRLISQNKTSRGNSYQKQTKYERKQRYTNLEAVVDDEETTLNISQVQSIRKNYCLGYGLKIKQQPKNQKPKNIIKQPKGYFQSSKENTSVSNLFSPIKNREWSEYVNLYRNEDREMAKERTKHKESLEGLKKEKCNMNQLLSKIFQKKEENEKILKYQSQYEEKQLRFPRIR